jgi:gas vesicle protein
MNLDQANEKIAFLEKRGQMPLGMVQVEKVVMDRMAAEKEELRRNNERLEREVKQAKEAIQQIKK